MFDKILIWIKNIIEKIKNFFFVKRNRSKKQQQPDQPTTYDNMNWTKIMKGGHNRENNEEEVIGKIRIPKDLYRMEGLNEVKLMFPIIQDLTSEVYFCKIEPNSYINMISDKDFHCLYPSVNVAGQQTKIFVSHVLMFLDENTRDKSTMINPQVYIIPKPTKTVPVVEHTRYVEATIYTKEIRTMTDYLITAVPLTHVNIMYTTKPKPKVGTVAITFNIPNDKEMYWSGSLVQYQKTLYIVGSVTYIEDHGIIKLVAYSVSTHGVTITIEEHEEE